MQRVPVTGDDQDAVATLVSLGGQRGDDVVGLEAGFGEHGDSKSIENLFGDVDLTAELIGGRCPAGLVFREPLGAEGLPGDVEGGGDVGWRFVAQQVDQHRGEAVDRVGGQAVLGLEVLRGQRVERPECQRIAVQEHQRRLVVNLRIHALTLGVR